MFQNLSEKLNLAIKKFRSKGKLTEADIKPECARLSWRCLRPT